VRRHNKGLFAIAIFKWCKAMVFCAVALGLLRLLHRDVGEVAENFIRSLRVDPDNEVLGALLTKLSFVNDPQLATLSAISFGYSALFLVEGTGLYFEQTWAEYLTIVATAALLPVEMYELVKKVDGFRITVLVINVAILVFLVFTVRSSSTKKRS
jgi:uncharacterized membrane protein (DUF2068 family)